MKKILVTGSIAYDNLMSFDGLFSDSFVGEKLENLSLSFMADEHEIFFGGCGPNIAFSLKLLGQSPILFGVAGNDFHNYAEWLESNGISIKNVFVDENSPTACANILTDKKQNQLTIFSPGAMKTHLVEIKLTEEAKNDAVLAIVSPELPDRMAYYCRYFRELGIPYIFDPGQEIPVLEKNSLEEMLFGSIGVVVNEYESLLLTKKIGASLEEIAEKLEFAIVTLEDKGCRLYEKGEIKEVGAVKVENVVDSTGCGDAFRAGFIHGYLNRADLTECCDIGNKTASIVLKVKGTQNHVFNF